MKNLSPINAIDVNAAASTAVNTEQEIIVGEVTITEVKTNVATINIEILGKQASNCSSVELNLKGVRLAMPMKVTLNQAKSIKNLYTTSFTMLDFKKKLSENKFEYELKATYKDKKGKKIQKNVLRRGMVICKPGTVKASTKFS